MEIFGPHTVTYRMSYTDEGWVVSPHEILDNEEFDSKSKINDALNLSENRHELIFDAFEKTHKIFLPHVPLGKDTAWILHKNLFKEFKEKLTYEKLLENPRKWPLAWYWKSAFSMLRNFQISEPTQYEIKICQVRQWVMFFGYSKERKKGKDQIKLMCPPLFGRSERLHAWDQYWLYLPFFDEIERLYTYEKKIAQTEIDLAYVLGRHDVTYRINNFELVDANCYQIELEAMLCLEPYKDKVPLITMLNKKECNKKPANRIHYKAKTWTKDSPTVKLHLPYNLVRVPCYDNKTDCQYADNEGRVPLLLTSDRYCQALAQMSEVWNDPTSKAALVIAPPGSGKEALSSSVYHFRDYTKKGRLITLSLSSEGQEESLFCIFNDPPGFRKLKRRIKDGRDNSVGFVLQAEGGMLFLDEIDKAPKEARNSLLRLLENDSFVVPGTSAVIPVKQNRPFYIFAGSKPQQEMFVLEPVDFWTRISHVIEMKHPLGVEDEVMRKHIIEEYFQLFWNRHVPKFFGHNGGTERVPFGISEKAQVIDSYYSDIFTLFLTKTFTDFLSSSFSNEIMLRNLNQLPSVRNIVTIAARICYELFEMLAHPKRDIYSLHRFRRELCLSAPNSIGVPWFVLVELILAEETHWKNILEEHKITQDAEVLGRRIGGICSCDQRNMIRKDFEGIVQQTSQLVLQYSGSHNNQSDTNNT